MSPALELYGVPFVTIFLCLVFICRTLHPHPANTKKHYGMYLYLPCRTQRLREAAASRSFHLKNTGVLRDLAFEPYTFVASAATTGSASAAGTPSGAAEGGSGEEGWDDWGDDDNAQVVRCGESERVAHASLSESRPIYLESTGVPGG